MFVALMRRCADALLNVPTAQPDSAAREIDAAIESIEQALMQIRRDFGIAEPG